MDYFKFSCPHCGTRIGTSPDTSGHQFNCPNCEGEAIIPPAPENPDDVPVAIAVEAPPAAADTDAADGTIMLKRSDVSEEPVEWTGTDGVDHFDGPTIPEIAELEKDNPFATAFQDTGRPAGPRPAAPMPPPPDRKPTTPVSAPAVAPATPSSLVDAPAPKPASHPTLKVISPHLKIELIKEGRAQIGDESKWVQGLDSSGKRFVAASKTGEEFIPEKPGSPTATHHSIIGAILLAMEKHHIAVTANGRSAMLGPEIEAAAQVVTGKPANERIDPMTLGHAQCLEVLDHMLETYSSHGKKKTSAAGGKAGGGGSVNDAEAVDIARLLSRDDERITPAEVLRTLYEEIQKLKQRVDELEND